MPESTLPAAIVDSGIPSPSQQKLTIVISKLLNEQHNGNHGCLKKNYQSIYGKKESTLGFSRKIISLLMIAGQAVSLNREVCMYDGRNLLLYQYPKYR